MKVGDFLKTTRYESNFLNRRLGFKSDSQNMFKKCWRSDSVSSKSLSSNSTAYTSNFDKKYQPNDVTGTRYLKNNPPKAKKTCKLFRNLDTIYQVINDLYVEEIVPSIHEIRRKINKNQSFSISGEKLLKLCSNDPRFQIKRLQSSSLNSKDVQNEWAILIRNRPFNHFKKQVDSNLIEIASEYLTFISSYQYYKLAECVKDRNEEIENNNLGLIIDQAMITLKMMNMEIVPIDDIFNVGGRYVFAEHLKNKGPIEFRNLPLGTIVNLVQKLNEVGLLVYRGNCLIPVVNSRSAANKYKLNVNKEDNQENVVEMRKNVIDLFKTEPKIPLSSLPIVYKRTYGVELNYSDLGYDKLSDFIKSEVRSCKIITRDNQYIATIPSELDEEVQLCDLIDSKKNDKKDSNNISQNTQRVSYTTLLYPLKMTHI